HPARFELLLAPAVVFAVLSHGLCALRCARGESQPAGCDYFRIRSRTGGTALPSACAKAAYGLQRRQTDASGIGSTQDGIQISVVCRFAAAPQEPDENDPGVSSREGRISGS